MITSIALIVVMVVIVISSITITGSGQGRAEGDQNSNEVFEEIKEFIRKWQTKSPSFRRKFSLSMIKTWSDYYPRKLAELERCGNSEYWLLKCDQLLMDYNHEEE